MIDILLIFLIVLVIIFDRLNTFLSNNRKNQIKLIGENLNSLSWKGFNLIELFLVSFFLIILFSLFFNFNNLSDLISNTLLNYMPFVFVYEEVAFYSLILISSVWFVLRFNFIFHSIKKIIARELFNFLYIVSFIFIGYLLFNSKNMSTYNRYVISQTTSFNYGYGEEVENVKVYGVDGPYDFLHYNKNFFSFRSLNKKMYPNRIVYLNKINSDDMKNYKVVEKVFYVYGEGIFLNGILIFYVIKILLGSILWGIKVLEE